MQSLPLKILLIIQIINLITAAIILQPINKEGPESGVVIFQGLGIDAKNYVKFAKELQSKSNGKLWVAIAEFSNNRPNSSLSNRIMNEIFAVLQETGFNFTKETPFYFIGHSFGGRVLQSYLLNYFKNIPVEISSLILEGSYIERKNFENFSKLSISVLTLGGELDGIIRITRMAESFHFNSKQDKARTLIIRGMNHYQFVGDGKPGPDIAKNDFKSEISDTDARDQVTSIISSLMNNVFMKNLKDYENSSKELLQPLVNAFLLEGSYNYKSPCYLTKQTDCLYGSKWSETSQKIMGTANMTSKDQFFSASSVFPDPLPSIENNCQTPNECQLKLNTVTELKYTSNQNNDVGSDPQGAIEMKSKLMSRQAVVKAATGVKIDFNQADGGDICAEINNESIRQALANSPKHITKRYNKVGKQLRTGGDYDMSNKGPLWIWKTMMYEDKIDTTTKRIYTEITAPTMKFPVDYWISYTAGFHFCKVLSPARAIEWIYFDSLKN